MRETGYGQPVLEGMLGWVEDEERRVRRSAAYALGWIGDAGAVGALLAWLEEEDENTGGIEA